MSNLVELLVGRELPMDLRDGVKFYAECAQGRVRAAGSRSGTVAIWSEDGPPAYMNLQPLKRKKRSEAELQGIWLSETGDILYAATSVDLLAVKTSTRVLAWAYQQKRQWGFLASIPQGGFLGKNDVLTLLYSSGEEIQIDRHSRVLRQSDSGYSPRLVAKSAQSDRVFGSDGHVVWSWDAKAGFESRALMIRKPCYSMTQSGNGRRLAMRSMNEVSIFDTETFEVLGQFTVDPGLPQLALDFSGRQLAHMTGPRIVFRSVDGEVTGAYDAGADFPISVHPSVSGQLIVGLRGGLAHSLAWPA